MKLRFLPAVREELDAAASYLEDRVPGLGEEFVEDVERTGSLVFHLIVRQSFERLGVGFTTKPNPPARDESRHGSFDIYDISPIPHIEFNAVSDLKSIIAVVDLTRVAGLDWRQVTDYIAMPGVTEVNLNAHWGEAPTIMRLFSTSGDTRLQSVSTWDRSLIKALYLTDPVYRHQRVLIAKRMFADISQ